ncbi:ATP-dependent RNA helicase DbpA [endosymbiont of Riftia pachyptila]|uniref:ATP-independent RNA helicase dbpA n=1 Tax=endosymbiont of Riftia pachyptila (vent Ph05) TaxID=1048808 RepID=G2DCE9_9GAMM|nr:ATP-dependent RNA helicase DbpA [endosymbiont of Riftia pachyptila]EGV51670.1 ATP-independent RNA helicase dbpA [endosymbiont of Riftia pachyptila (vent Ph05)]
MSQTDFSSLKLHPALLKNLSTLGYLAMTPIQAQSLPHILDGKDVIAQGKTGSGKTAAFGLGLLEKLDVKRFRVQSLVLCPTRELADQVAKEVRKLARSIHNIKVLTLCGGMPFGPQIGSLEHGAHIIVGTPGRVEEHLRKGTLRLDSLNMLVLDEADRMLDMGFQPALDAIIKYTPQQRQTLLFSATYPSQIESIAQRIMIHPVVVQVAATHDSTSIQQYFYRVDANTQRMTILQLLLLKYRPESALVFCNTKRETQEVADELHDLGFSALALHGDLEQKARDQTLVRFANKSASILVATDVASRGLDIDALDAVINYHLSRELEVHVHRIGRTGRAGSKGIACTLYNDKERYKVEALEEYLDQRIVASPLPPFSLLEQPTYKPPMVTLQIDGGKKQKVRPGDILGALTGKNGIAGKQVGKIHIFDNWAYVAVSRDAAQTALIKLGEGKLKGRSFRVRRIRG